jgi:hypothetical protein
MESISLIGPCAPVFSMLLPALRAWRGGRAPVKEPFSCMLRYPGLPHELPQTITLRSEDESSIGGPSVGRLLPVIFDGSGAFEHTDIFAFLRFSLNLFPDEDKGCHRLDRTPQKESSGVGIAAFSFRRKGLVVGMEVVTPNNA